MASNVPVGRNMEEVVRHLCQRLAVLLVMDNMTILCAYRLDPSLQDLPKE